ncbi:MAG: hypothetical protein A2X86_04530 [Bdellovibrionales bacterium GWA2_49_15]|nr:MAG: hypothetical protein A2X86_04530 [Bdellovibrionales bacterium GWA2_49_15]
MAGFAKDKKAKPVKQNNTLSRIDETQQFISDQWTDLNYNTDIFFSNRGYRKTENKSMIMAYYAIYKKESFKPAYNFDLKIKVHLPSTTKRMKIVIEKERDEILESTSSEALNSKNGETTPTKSNYIAGLSYLLSSSPYYETFLDFGMKILLPLDPFAKFRIQKNVTTSYVNISAAQKFIFYRQDGFQEVSQLSFSRKFNQTFQTEQANSLSWEDKTDTFILRNGLALYQTIADEKTMSYSIGANAFLSPVLYYYNYDCAVSYRQLIHSKWLYASLAVGADFPKQHDFHMEKFILGRVEVFFR